MGFTKLDEGLMESSLMRESSETFKVFIVMLSRTHPDGIARLSATFLSAVCCLPQDVVDASLKTLESPDPYSRSANDEGRRIRRVDGGYKILNYKRYRYYKYDLNPQENKRREAWRYENENTDGYVYFIHANDRVKVGFSKNPWARLCEIRTSNIDANLIGTIPGTIADEGELHRKFKKYHIAREWFRPEKDLMDDIFELLREKGGRVAERTTGNPVSPESSTTVLDDSRENELRSSTVVYASASASSLNTKKKTNYDFDPSVGSGKGGHWDGAHERNKKRFPELVEDGEKEKLN